MTKKSKNALLIIDVQNDFCQPTGTLYVKGAEEDSKRIAKFITSGIDEIDYIAATLDSHYQMDIAHPAFWKDKDGNQPNPFTVISAQEVRDGKWTPRNKPVAKVIEYLDKLAISGGNYVHVVWPTHCLIGSTGHAIDKPVLDAIHAWEIETGRSTNYVTKGTNDMTEHFGAFRAQVPIEDRPETNINMRLLDTLSKFDNVYLTGQAKSHCVANTLSQALEIAPGLASKIVVLEDCMSDVADGPGGPGTSPTWGQIAQPIYDKAKAAGVRFSTSTKERQGQKTGAAQSSLV